MLSRQNKAVRGCGNLTDLSHETLVSQNIAANLGEISLQKHILAYLTTVSGRTGLSAAGGPT